MRYVDWGQIETDIDSHGFMSGIQRESSRVKATAEVFTPTSIVVDLLKNIPIESFGPGKTVLDPACGDGQFLAGALAVKLRVFGMNVNEALQEIFGVDIMRDNVDLCKARLGGGVILMGNTLDPHRRLPGQTDEEYSMMVRYFDPDSFSVS